MCPSGLRADTARHDYAAKGLVSRWLYTGRPWAAARASHLQRLRCTICPKCCQAAALSLPFEMLSTCTTWGPHLPDWHPDQHGVQAASSIATAHLCRVEQPIQLVQGGHEACWLLWLRPDFVLALHAALNVLLVPGIPVVAALQVGLAQHNIGLQK